MRELVETSMSGSGGARGRRVTVNVAESPLAWLGARGLIRPSANTLQVVLGPIADTVAVEIRDAIAGQGAQTAAMPLPPVPSAGVQLTPAVLSALGDAANIQSASRHGNRVRLVMKDDKLVAAEALHDLGVLAIVRPGANIIHLLLDTGRARTIVEAPEG